MTNINFSNSTKAVSGKFVTIEGDKFYQIKNSDQMAPFFISVVSASDHWLFISSTGALSAGRIRPENALFPYKSVDYIHESAENTGSKTIVKVQREEGIALWEPFNLHHNALYDIQRNMYKNSAGDKIIFEEINLDLGLTFKYQWATSEDFGFVRTASIENNAKQGVEFEILDGMQNLLPPNAPLSLMQTSSALLDAYKWNELAADSSLANYSLYARLSDRADPAESLLTTTAFSVVEGEHSILLSSQQLDAFRQGRALNSETVCRGVRGAYFVHKACKLAAREKEIWMIAADIDQSHADVAKLQKILTTDKDIMGTVNASIDANHQDLLMLMAGSDAYQKTQEEETSVHHYANVLFNNMRGGVIVDQYWVEKADFIKTLTQANSMVAQRHTLFLDSLDERIDYQMLLTLVAEQDDTQLMRLCYEYLPLTFGRRHGDPSRPWNHFEIKLKDEKGDKLLSYQGNWRDIFQNWEALSLSYPTFIESFISKFVNASTIDGYNPYRITKEGVDWELLESDDPWSNIGYWGDHQIIYLQKFLELSKKYHPQELKKLLSSDIFSYANVPYEIEGVDKLFADPKNTVIFNDDKQAQIEKLVAEFGSDGRLVLDADNNVYMVNLTEKLLVPLLSKLSNLVVDGGIWLNTQRPEWNDANNAIVGTGLSMVTLYYMRRYVAFMQDLLQDGGELVQLSVEVSEWLSQTAEILKQANIALRNGSIDSAMRSSILRNLEAAAATYRRSVYEQGFTQKVFVDNKAILGMLNESLNVIDESIKTNLREDGLYNAYNIIDYTDSKVDVDLLYPMLEGQVSILSAGVLTAKQVVSLLDKMYASDMYRADQHTFTLYPDRDLKHFVDKNNIPTSNVESNALLQEMLAQDDRRIIEMDVDGQYHFNASFENAGALLAVLNELGSEYASADGDNIASILAIYEEVFNHQAFTGRSGTMFGYEGLGSIYWHMVSKLLLAVQENYFMAWEQDATSKETQKLAHYYYKVRAGIGFNKTPDVYGAFPTDPYSHTPKQAGAQQPGMTGQVKEEVITRFGELGVLVDDAQIRFQPSLLKESEFLTQADEFVFINQDSAYQSIALEADSLAFTYCQTPFVYKKTEQETISIKVEMADGEVEQLDSAILDETLSHEIFARSGVIAKVIVSIPQGLLFNEA